MERFFVMSVGKENYSPGLHMIAATRKGMTKEAAHALAKKLTAEDLNGARFFVGTVIGYYEPERAPVRYQGIQPDQMTFEFDGF